MTQIVEPFPIFYDDDGTPLDDGQVYIGEAGQDPRANPVAVFYDEARTLPAEQPIRTNGGRPSYQGAPTRLYIAEVEYSIAVLNKFGTPITSDLEGMVLTAADVAFTQSGTGAVARTVQAKLRDTVSVKDFGAAGDGSTNDSAAFTAALAATAAMPNGGDLMVPAGIYMITEQTVPANVRVFLQEGAEVQPFAVTPSLFKVTGGLSGVYNGRFSNVSSRATSAILIDKPFNNTSCFVVETYFASFSEAIRVEGGDCIHINESTFISCDISVRVIDEFINSNIANNYMLGGNGIRLGKTAQGPEGVSIYGNKILPATGGTYCIRLEAGLEIDIFSNILDQIITGDGVVIDGAAGEIANIKFHHNWVGRQVAATAADYGLFAVNNIRGLLIEANTFVGFTEANINLNGLGAGKLLDVTIQNNVHYYADAALRDIQLTDVTAILIDGETFTGTASIVENSGVVGRVANCKFNVLPTAISGGLLYGPQKDGMVLTNKGGATVSTPARTVTVTHGLSYTPAATDVTITPTQFPVNDPGNFIIDTIGSTTFRIVSANDPGAGGCTVAWRADMTR